MKKITFIVVSLLSVLVSCKTADVDQEVKLDEIVQVHQGAFAFCGASAAVPTGKTIVVQGVEYQEGCAVCPVLTGPSISNLAMQGVSGTYGKFNVGENPQTPDGTNNTVWSFFWYYDSTTTVPQFDPSTKEWQLLPPINRSFIVNLDSPSTSESNMFAMPGIIFDTTDSGIVLAKVYGPLNEAAVPLRKAVPVESGMTSITAAKEGYPYPVGTPVPISNLSKELQKTKKY